MAKKVLFWALGIIGAVVIGGGAYLYYFVSSTADAIHQPLDRDGSKKRTEKVEIEKKTPISILMLGVDERQGDRGRSDSLMLITVNPNDNSVKLVSIPRDTRTEIVGKGKQDKINHAYAFGGIQMSMDTVENFLNIPVDYYIEVNMEGFKDIVDAVGGVTVNNPFEFTYQGEHFDKGIIDLNGKRALIYSRMRKQDPNGDFGRQYRQRQVLQAVISRGAKVDSLANFGDILGAVQKNVKTNLTLDEMYNIQKNYRDASKNIEEIQIPGKGTKIDGIYYYIVSDETRNELSQKLRQQLELTAQK